MQTLDEKVKSVDLSDFKIDKVTKTNDFVLIEAHLQGAVYFAFYSHFIVCSGDFGEWVFDCTWETTKHKILGNLSYLLSKLSFNSDKYYYDIEEVIERFHEARKNFYETYNIVQDEFSDENSEELDALFDDFETKVHDADKYRITSVVDEYAEEICDLLNIEFDSEIWNDFYTIGSSVHPQLIVNLAMLEKISGMDLI